MSKRKVSVEDKICAVNLYLDGKESQRLNITGTFTPPVRNEETIVPD